MDYLTLKSIHIISIVAWFAGLFYLPRLFVYHSNLSPSEQKTYELFCLMEWRLYHQIMLPACLATVLSGVGLFMKHPAYWQNQRFFFIKILCALLLFVYFIITYWHLRQFQKKKNAHSNTYYRCFNEIPTVLLITIITLIVIKPDL